jgi:hypothetical protein
VETNIFARNTKDQLSKHLVFQLEIASADDHIAQISFVFNELDSFTVGLDCKVLGSNSSKIMLLLKLSKLQSSISGDFS